MVAAEACYGGQLESISPSRSRLGICEVYLKNGAYGFVGSTTIAYGDLERNGDADLLCQFFLEGVLQGASLGRAFLEARQRFIREASPLDPAERKTLAQFNLYGDPSVTPVSNGGLIASSQRPMMMAVARVERSERQDRRRALFQQGAGLAEREPVMRKSSKQPARSARGTREAVRLQIRSYRDSSPLD